MQRRTRNRICIWIIFGGLINFLFYTVLYWDLGGDAKNGSVEAVAQPDGSTRTAYYIQGHFIHGAGGGKQAEVAKWVWIYSYLHSISLWPTQGAMVICMLILARPHIIATMQESPWIRGPTFITVVMTITIVLCSVLTLLFTLQFIHDLV